ncbi:hypothetical protein JRQ81_016408, partial [Phrynocephalus forsythii]
IPGKPPGLERDLMEEFAFIIVKFLPLNTTSLIQPMDHCSIEDAPIVEEIVNLGDSLGLDVSNADGEELLEGHRTELMTEELQSIMTEQERAAAEENV